MSQSLEVSAYSLQKLQFYLCFELQTSEQVGFKRLTLGPDVLANQGPPTQL